MNKPILVRNNEEWNRLSPVLEALGYIWSNGKKPTQLHPSDVEGRAVLEFYIYNSYMKYLRYSYACKEPSQSVDKYLTSQEQPKETLMHLASPLQQQNNTEYWYKQSEYYRLKFESLEQGVKDAKAEMGKTAKGLEFDSSESILEHDGERSDEYSYQAVGIHAALEIFTRKTGI